MAIIEKECAWCGRPFQAAQHAQKYCSRVCLRESQIHHKRELRARAKHNKLCKNMSEIARINGIARSCGTSYGKYIASTI